MALTECNAPDKSLTVNSLQGTHALVLFDEDEKTAVIPVNRVTVIDGVKCEVVWSNKKRYKASLILSGSKEKCEERQNEDEMIEDQRAGDGKESVIKQPSGDSRKTKENVNPISKKHRKRKQVNKQCDDEDIQKHGSDGGMKKKANKDKVNKKKSDVFQLEVGVAPKRFSSYEDLFGNSDGVEEVINVSDHSSGGSSSSSLEDESLESQSNASVSLSDNSSSEHTTDSHRKTMVISVDSSAEIDDTVRKNPPKHYTGGKQDPELLCKEIAERVTTLEKDSAMQTTDMNWKYDDLRTKVLAMNGTITEMKKVLTVLFKGRSDKGVEQSVAVIPESERSQPAVVPHSAVLPTFSMESSCIITSPPVTASTATAQLTHSVQATCNRGSTSNIGSIPSEESTSIVGTTPCEGSASITGLTSITDLTSDEQPLSSAASSSSAGSSSSTGSTSPDLTVNGITDSPGSSVEVTTSDCLLTDSELMQLYLTSCSRKNFAAKLSARLFTDEIRLTHNVSGRGKPKLDPKITSYIRIKCFQMFPCNSTEKAAVEWGECIKAIDEKSRRLKRPKKS